MSRRSRKHEEKERYAERNGDFIFSIMKFTKNYERFPIHRDKKKRFDDVRAGYGCGLCVLYYTDTRSHQREERPIYVGQTSKDFKTYLRQLRAIESAFEKMDKEMHLWTIVSKMPDPIACFMKSFLLEEFNFCLNKSKNSHRRNVVDDVDDVLERNKSAVRSAANWVRLMRDIKDLNEKFKKIL